MNQIITISANTQMNDVRISELIDFFVGAEFTPVQQYNFK